MHHRKDDQRRRTLTTTGKLDPYPLVYILRKIKDGFALALTLGLINMNG